MNYTFGARVTVTDEVLRDAAVDVQALIAHDLADAFDRHLRPWAYPDRINWPRFDPFPRWTRLVEWWQRWREEHTED